MSDHVSLVENIRAFLARSDQANNAALAELADRYAAMTRATNERLLKCADFLRRGLRSEAIHLAEAEPKLLEVVAVLDLAEFAQWEEVCALYGLAVPQAMMMEPAAQLNEAYSEEVPIQGLLRKHRLLALSLAPLQERIGVLRQIATADPGSMSWTEDLKTYETQRVRLISAEMSDARERGDVEALEAIHAELAGPWSTDGVRKLKQQVAGALAQVKQADLAVALRALVPQIHEAHSAMDLVQLEFHMSEWGRLGESVPGDIPKQLVDEVADAMAWATAERARQLQATQYDAARFALEEALEKDAPDEELASLRAEAMRLGESLPPVLEQRYQSAREARRTLLDSRRRRNTIVVAAAVLAVSGISIWMVNATLQDREAASWATSIRGDLQSKQIEQAAARLAEVSKTKPKLLSRPVLAQVNLEFDAALAKDRQRAEELAVAVSKAEAAESAGEPAVNLSAISTLARTPEEKARVEAIVRRVNTSQQIKQRERDDAFADGVQALQAKLSVLATQWPEVDRESFARALTELDREVASLADRPKVSPVIARTLQPSRDRLAKLRADMDTSGAREVSRQKEASLLEAVQSATTVQLLRERLDRFVTSADDSPQSVEFKRALQAAGHWEALVRWSTLRREWSSMMPSDARDLAKRIASVKAYLAEQPESPVTEVVSGYAAFLDRTWALVDREGRQRKALATLISSPLISRVMALRMKDGSAYYVMDNEELAGGEVLMFDALVSADVTQLRRTAKPRRQLEGSPQFAAQVGWAKQVRERTTDVTPVDAERLILDLTQDLVGTNGMDPLLQAILIQRMLQMSLEPVGPPDAKIEGFLVDLTEFNPAQYPWMNPENVAANRARDGAARLLKQIPPLKPVIEQTLKRRDEALKAADLSLTGPMAAIRAASGWEVKLASGVRDGTRAVAVFTSGNSASKAELVDVGVVKAGKLAFNPQMDRLPGGTAVFLVSEQR